jgi:hypothetical protein
LRDEQIEKLQQINRFIVSQNSVPGITWSCKSKRSITMERRQKVAIEQGGLAPCCGVSTKTKKLFADKIGIQK